MANETFNDLAWSIKRAQLHLLRRHLQVMLGVWFVAFIILSLEVFFVLATPLRYVTPFLLTYAAFNGGDVWADYKRVTKEMEKLWPTQTVIDAKFYVHR